MFTFPPVSEFARERERDLAGGRSWQSCLPASDHSSGLVLVQQPFIKDAECMRQRQESRPLPCDSLGGLDFKKFGHRELQQLEPKPKIAKSESQQHGKVTAAMHMLTSLHSPPGSVFNSESKISCPGSFIRCS